MRTLLFTTVMLFALQLSAQDCLPGWAYYAEVTLDNSAGDALVDYQVRLEMNTGALVTAGKMNADGSDLRFVDMDCNLIHYFMDSLATNEDNVIWLKIPEIAAASSLTIRAYYGNTDAIPYASGDDTFIFFDDFSSGTVDLNKWDPVGEYNTLEVVDGTLNYSSTGDTAGPRFKFVRTAMDFVDPVIFEFNAAVTNSNGFGFSSGDVDLDRILFRQSGFGFDTLNQVALMLDTLNNGISVSQEYPIIRFERYAYEDGIMLAGINMDDNLQLNTFGSYTSNSFNTDSYVLESVDMTSFHFILSGFSVTNVVYLEYLRVRSLPIMFPNPAIGPEQFNPLNTAVIEPVWRVDVNVSPNPSAGTISLKQDSYEALEVWIYNALGQRLAQLSSNLESGQAQSIDLSPYQSGIYWLTFQHKASQEYLITKKLILKK